jgi:hypothetical protein
MLSVLRLFGIGDGIVNKYEADDGTRIERGSRCNQRKPDTVPLCPP